jgi:hypothetical protein
MLDVQIFLLAINLGAKPARWKQMDHLVEDGIVENDRGVVERHYLPAKNRPFSWSKAGQTGDIHILCEISVQRTHDGSAASVEHMRINHSCRNIFMPQQFLHGSYIVAVH